jgi:hypothetical protein
MIFLPLNYGGVVNSLNNLDVKILIEVHNPSTIFLQELMIDEEKVVQYLSKLLRGWDFSFIDAI